MAAPAALDSLSRLQSMAAASPLVRQLRRLQALVDGAAGLPSRTDVVDMAPLNRTGMPDALKTGSETLAGQSLDHMQVHNNSSQLNALAYPQGVDIHLVPVQDWQVHHEARHVVQQKRGRIKPAKQFKPSSAFGNHVNLPKKLDVACSEVLQTASTEWLGLPASRNLCKHSTIQRFDYSASEFKNALTESIFGVNSFPKIERVLNKPLFLNDLISTAQNKFNSSKEVELGGNVWRFIKVMDEALTYRAENLDAVRTMRRNNPAANFGDVNPETNVRLKGGSQNPWPSVCVNQFPNLMRNRVTNYVNGLHDSVSLGGRGYDYRPTPGILFHILK